MYIRHHLQVGPKVLLAVGELEEIEWGSKAYLDPCPLYNHTRSEQSLDTLSCLKNKEIHLLFQLKAQCGL